MMCPVCNGTRKDPRGGGCFNCRGTGKVASAASNPDRRRWEYMRYLVQKYAESEAEKKRLLTWLMEQQRRAERNVY